MYTNCTFIDKNKRTFKPKLGKNKRDRERDISNDDGTFQKSASEKSDEIQTNIESTKNQKLHVPKKRQIMLRDIPFLQKDKGKPKAVYDKKEESSEVSTRSIPIKDKGKQRAVYKDAIQEETEESIDSSGPTSPVEWIREVIETQHSDDPHELEIVYPDTLREIEHDLNVPPPKEFNDDKLETSIDRKRKLLEIAASTAGVQSSRKGKMWTDLETQVFYDVEYLKVKQKAITLIVVVGSVGIWH